MRGKPQRSDETKNYNAIGLAALTRRIPGFAEIIASSLF